MILPQFQSRTELPDHDSEWHMMASDCQAIRPCLRKYSSPLSHIAERV